MPVLLVVFKKKLWASSTEYVKWPQSQKGSAWRLRGFIQITEISGNNLPDSFHITCQQWLLLNLEMEVKFFSISWKAVLFVTLSSFFDSWVHKLLFMLKISRLPLLLSKLYCILHIRIIATWIRAYIYFTVYHSYKP